MMPKNNFSYIRPIAITAKAKFSIHRLKMAKFLKMSFLGFSSSSLMCVCVNSGMALITVFLRPLSFRDICILEVL